MNWKKTIRIAGLFLTLSNVPVKKRNNRKVGECDNIDSTFRMKDLRREVKAAQGDRCPMTYLDESFITILEETTKEKDL